jgi:hypothetical protein
VLVAQLLIHERLVVTLELLLLVQVVQQARLLVQQVLLLVVVPLELVEHLYLVQRFPLEHLAYWF